MEAQEKHHRERISFLDELRQMRMRTAQDGLRDALKEAQAEGAHVIITVGSYMNRAHDEGSLIRQQFPVERLKNIAPEDKIHLIHIDPAFRAHGEDTEPQYHEQPGWKLSHQDQSDLVRTFTNDNYKITTIAHEIVSTEEVEAYFQAIGKPQSILNVDLTEHIELATKEGRGFITGNFYDKKAEPVIAVEPAVGSELIMSKH